MSSDNKFKINSGDGSHNYQAAGDIKQHFGDIIQTIAQSKLAKIAAVMTIVAGSVAVAQYVGSLPANFKLANVSLRYNGQFGHNDFNFVMQNQGPDNIRNLEWYAWLEGGPFSLKNILRGRASIVARGDMYVDRNVGEGSLPADVNFQNVDKAKMVKLCLTYDGPLPGTRQWMLLSTANRTAGYSGGLNAVNGAWPNVVDTGGGIRLISSGCAPS